MSFNCSQFQHQLKRQNRPLRDQIFQTVFLNDDHKSSWTKSEIRSGDISASFSASLLPETLPLGSGTDSVARRSPVRVDEFHQVRHDWRHYLRLPFLSLCQSHKRHTHFAGAWSLVNAHEVAMISGLAASYALGAGYPPELEHDAWAKKTFEGYLSLAYRQWGKSAKKKKVGPWPRPPLASKSSASSSEKSSKFSSTALL